MTSNIQRWLQLLDVFTAWGEASARNGTPLPSDDELWAAARRPPQPLVPEQINPERLAELREAFNDGRQPTRIDLQAVADLVTRRGHHAYVEQTGGNTATIYAGRQIPDRYGEPRWSAAAGRAGSRRPAGPGRSPTPASSTSDPTATTPGACRCPPTPRPRWSPT